MLSYWKAPILQLTPEKFFKSTWTFGLFNNINVSGERHKLDRIVEQKKKHLLEKENAQNSTIND
jgi:hypothetical protein